MSGRRLARGTLAATVLVALATALTGCVAPAFDSGAFQRNAIHALESAVSDTRTGAMTLELHLDDRVMRPYADTVLTESEDAIGPVEDSFGVVDPPTDADAALRTEVGDLLTDAGNALADARIALRSGDRAAMAQSVTQLRAVADAMEQASERLS